MDPCGIPALIDSHPYADHITFDKINGEPETPIDLSLNISPWCQTLWKALHISKNTPWVSRK